LHVSFISISSIKKFATRALLGANKIKVINPDGQKVVGHNLLNLLMVVD